MWAGADDASYPTANRAAPSDGNVGAPAFQQGELRARQSTVLKLPRPVHSSSQQLHPSRRVWVDAVVQEHPKP